MIASPFQSDQYGYVVHGYTTGQYNCVEPGTGVNIMTRAGGDGYGIGEIKFDMVNGPALFVEKFVNKLVYDPVAPLVE